MVNDTPSTNWDFKGADTKALTHCLHAYPAMMIPQIAGRLMDLYGSNARVLLDPYCGSGTSLVEANVRGLRAKGSDLNPLARLIASAKTRRLPIIKARKRIQEMRDHLLACNFKTLPRVDLPAFDNVDFWFPTVVQEKLSVLKSYINKVDEEAFANFLLVAFSETVRECSYTRNGEFKLYRMPEQQRRRFAPDVFGVFEKKMERNYAGLQAFMKAAPSHACTQIFEFNSVENIPSAAVPPESVDIVVTSPPYGDSGTTVAYGQFSRLANEWLQFPNAAAVDRRLMGGNKSNEISSLGFAPLNEAVDKIFDVHTKRAREVCSFYNDYRRSIANVAATLKPGGVACYVVGNRKVKGVVLPTDRATAHYFEENGFVRENTFVRNIPNKRMPSRNSPSNVPGATDNTMCIEHIIVMRKSR